MTGVQALERKASDLPLAPGKVQRRDIDLGTKGKDGILKGHMSKGITSISTYTHAKGLHITFFAKFSFFNLFCTAESFFNLCINRKLFFISKFNNTSLMLYIFNIIRNYSAYKTLS
jgi:hypothetical protein